MMGFQALIGLFTMPALDGFRLLARYCRARTAYPAQARFSIRRVSKRVGSR